MANISQGSTENIVLGEGYSPWALNSNDLYPDSTSYIVGIGNSNPDTALHITAADGADFLKLDNGSYSSTLSLADSGQELIFKSDAYWATFSTKIRNTSESGSPGNTFLHLQAYGGLAALYFDDWTESTETSQGVGALVFNIEDERAALYGDDGFAGGMLTMDWAQAFDTRFGFGYGDEALSNDARLAIKHTSSPQLLLDNGTESYTFKAVSSSIEVSTAFDFTTGTALLKTNGKEVLWADDTTGLVSLGFDTDFTNLIMRLSGTASLGYGSAQTGAKFSILDNSNPQLKLDDGTSSTTFQHDDNAGAPVLRLDSSTLEIEDSVSGGGTQIVLKNGAGDTSTFSQNSTDQSLEIVTTDYDLNLYSSHASGNVSLCNAAGTRKVMWQNSDGVFSCMGSQRRDQKWVTTTAGAFTAADDDECFVYLCDTSEADVETAGALTFNLPADSTMTGRYLIVKDTGGLAETYNINITANGSDKIDNNGSGVVSIEQNYGSVTLFEAGGWWTIA